MPTVMLTDRYVDALKATDRRVEYFDQHTAGLAIRVTESGKKTWVLLFRTAPNVATGEAPRLRRLTLGRYPDLDLKGARRQAQIARGKVAEGEDPAAAKQAVRQAGRRAGDTVADLAREYLTKYAKVHKRSWRDDDRFLEAEVLPAWRARKVRDITRRDVRELIEGIADRGSPISANRCLALVRRMLNWAVSKDWIEGNPAALLEKPGVERSRDRVLSDEEIRLIWKASESERPAMAALLKLRLLTAQRGGELAKIRWDDIDGDWLTLPGTITKNKQPHRVPLTPMAQAILTALPRIAGCSYVFPGRGVDRPLGDAKKGGRRVAQRVLATLKQADPTIETFDFRGHDLRRTAATRMAAAGVPHGDVAKVLNHAEGGPRATAVYNRYRYDREKRIALETWERALTGVLSEQSRPGDVVPITAGGGRG